MNDDVTIASTGTDRPSEDVHISPFAHLIAPIAAIGATMLVRKIMTTGYERATGHAAPAPRDPNVSFSRALMWTAVTAATAAVVEVAVYRIANQWGEKRP